MPIGAAHLPPIYTCVWLAALAGPTLPQALVLGEELVQGEGDQRLLKGALLCRFLLFISGNKRSVATPLVVSTRANSRVSGFAWT